MSSRGWREAAAEKSLEAFLEQSWHTFDPAELKSNWHLGAIADATQNLLQGHTRLQVIMAPPRNGKTSITSVAAFPFAWIENPGLRGIYVSHCDDLAREHSRNARKLLRSRWYQDRWGDRFSLTKADEWIIENSLNGKREVRTMDSTTGFGGNVLAVDDPHDYSKVSTEGDRKAKIKFFRNLITRMNDPKKDRILVVAQRVHPNDLIGFIVEQLQDMGWEILCLPIEHDPSHPFSWKKDPREPGEPLHPEREGPKEIREKETQMGKRKFAAQCKLLPDTEEGGSFKDAMWDFIDLPPDGLIEVRFWDFAKTDETDPDVDWKPSSSAGVRIGYHPDRKWVVIRDVIDGKWSASKVQDHVVNCARMVDGPEVELVLEQENGSNGAANVVWYTKELRGHKVKAWPVGRSHADAQPLIAAAEVGLVKIVKGPWNDEFLEQMRYWPNGRHQDQAVAAIGGHARLLEKIEDKLPKGTPSSSVSLEQ